MMKLSDRLFILVGLFAPALTAVASSASSMPSTEGSADADVSIAVSDGAAVVAPNGTVTWSVAVNNLGPDATLAQVQDSFPYGVSGVTWTCASAGGAICTAAGSSNISDVVYLPTAGSLLYTASGTVMAARGTTVTNTALIGTLNGVFDPVTSNNVSGDSFVVDFTAPPRVSRVDAGASPLGCKLSDGVETKEAISQIVLRFDQPMADPPGNTSAVDVTNPSNYALIDAGGDGVLQTTQCSGAPNGDDQVVPINSLDFQSSSMRVSLRVEDAQTRALPTGSYRLLACAAGLQRDTGTMLDGNGDGTSGDDFRSDFRILETNLIQNPNFDHPFAGYWVMPLGTVVDHETDADSIPYPWSQSITTIFTPSVLTRCEAVPEPGRYQAGYRSTSTDSQIQLQKMGPACTDGSVQYAVANQLPFPPAAPGHFDLRKQTETLTFSASDVAAGGSVFIVISFLYNPSQPDEADTVWLRKLGDKIFQDSVGETWDCSGQ